jgi:hypothetical protein
MIATISGVLRLEIHEGSLTSAQSWRQLRTILLSTCTSRLCLDVHKVRRYTPVSR